MQRTTFSYQPPTGWSESFPNLDSDQTLLVAFGAPEYRDDPGPLRELRDAFPKAVIAGCSSSGEIFADKVQDHSIVVGVVRFERTTCRSSTVDVLELDGSFAAGKNLGNELNASDLRAVFVLSDGLAVNGSGLVRGLSSVLADSVVITGGLAGDGDRFESTWVLQDGEPVPNVVQAVGLYGASIRVGHGSQGGWDVFGPERLVTKSEGSVLYELDGKPALSLYKQYLGELAVELPASGLLFPLALRSVPSTDHQIVRTILAVDEETQSLTFAGDVPEGHHAQLMQANFERLIDGAETAASLARSPEDGLAVAISCVGRRLVLGARTEQETEATAATLGDSMQQIGFYSYGEISPLATGACDLHNQTMTLTTLTELP